MDDPERPSEPPTSATTTQTPCAIAPETSPSAAKETPIRDACTSRDLVRLRELAASEHGLLNDEARVLAWPLLLGSEAADGDRTTPWEKLARHRDEDQVLLDVNRAFVYYPTNESEQATRKRKQDLQDLIVETLRRHPCLCYFQGYHDIVQVLLLVLGRETAAGAVARLSLLRLRDFMLPTLGPSISQLRLLPSLLQAADAQVAMHLSHTEPFFALAATITLYAHDIQEYGDIARLYDFLLSHEAVISIYLFAVIIVSRRDELLEIEKDEPEMLHSILSKLPKPLDLEKLISKTTKLFAQHPPRTLPAFRWPWISTSSVLKTTSDLDALTRQTLGDGEKLFMKQAREMKVLQGLSQVRARAWTLRRPAAAVSVAVIVAVLSYWLRQEAPSSFLFSYYMRARRYFV